MNQSHALENTMVLATVQAFIGSITPSMSAISISVDADKETAELYVALNTADATITTMLEDVVTDISVLTEDAVSSPCTLGVGDDWTTTWPGRDRRMVFAAFRR